MSAPLLVLAPHPDDEILGAGGLMARARAKGDDVAVVVLTDGRSSDPAIDPDALVAVREGECRRGLDHMLGAAPPLLMLGEPDGDLDARAVDIGPGSLLARLCEAMPGATLLVTDPADGHRDHKAAFGVASRLAAAGLVDRICVMPVSQRVDGVFDPAGWEAHPVGDFGPSKRRAIGAHRSQLDTATGFAIPAEARAAFLYTEYLRDVFDRHTPSSYPQVVAPDHFDDLFTRSEDPWGYDTAPYERDRFERTLAALGGGPYDRVLELGCANGALTQRLASICTSLLAIDGSAAAAALARRRLGRVAGVTIEQRHLPDACPEGPFDLIVVSDLLYYLGLEGIAVLMAALDKSAAPGARMLIANYLGSTECALSGEMAAETALAHLPGWRITRAVRTDRLRIETLDRP